MPSDNGMSTLPQAGGIMSNINNIIDKICQYFNINLNYWRWSKSTNHNKGVLARLDSKNNSLPTSSKISHFLHEMHMFTN